MLTEIRNIRPHKRQTIYTVYRDGIYVRVGVLSLTENFLIILIKILQLNVFLGL